MSNRLQEKVVIVTGAAQGIGFGGARLLAAEGAAVVLGDIQKERGEQSAAIIRKEGGEALFCPADVREEQQCAALIEKAVQSYGKLNGLVNNAGWFPRATLEETTTELWEQILQVNLRSAFYCCKHAVPRMREAKGGSIVNIGSICGIQSLPNLVAYGAAKGGLLSLTRTLAGALSDDRIRVNYVIPGWVLTEGELAIQRARCCLRRCLLAQRRVIAGDRNDIPHRCGRIHVADCARHVSGLRRLPLSLESSLTQSGPLNKLGVL